MTLLETYVHILTFLIVIPALVIYFAVRYYRKKIKNK
jgi:hypothetical protein